MLSRTLRSAFRSRNVTTSIRSMPNFNRVHKLHTRLFSLQQEVIEHNADDSSTDEEKNAEYDIYRIRSLLLDTVNEVAALQENPIEDVDELRSVVENVEPSALTAVLVLHQLYKSKNYDQVVDLYEKLSKQLLVKSPSQSQFEEAQKYCSAEKEGNCVYASINTLSELKKSDIKPVHLGNKMAVIAASHLGKCSKAYDLLQELRSSGLDKTTRMYISAVKHVKEACENNSQVEMANELSDELDSLKKR